MRNTIPHIITVGLGFGDEGKGSVVDALCAKAGIRNVVRHSGGPQAAHNVVADGHHCFAQLGAGMMNGLTTTWHGPGMMVNPINLRNEWEVFSANELRARIDPSRVITHRDCLLVTPYHCWLNKLRELYRGKGAHGSCGMGIGETRDYADKLIANGHPDFVLRIGDLQRPNELREKLGMLKTYVHQQIQELTFGAVEDMRLADLDAARIAGVMEEVTKDFNWAVLDEYRQWLTVGDDDRLLTMLQNERAIFEGAQGMLLDEKYGFAPHTTWSDTTGKPAIDLVAAAGAQAFTVGITRSFHTRHGNGSLPGETGGDDMSEYIPYGEHNTTGDYQGHFRYAPLNISLLEYALKRAKGSSPADGFIMTHMDYNPPAWMTTVTFAQKRASYSGWRERTDEDLKVDCQYSTDNRIWELPARVTDWTGVPCLGQSFGAKRDDKYFARELLYGHEPYLKD